MGNGLKIFEIKLLGLREAIGEIQMRVLKVLKSDRGLSFLYRTYFSAKRNFTFAVFF